MQHVLCSNAGLLFHDVLKKAKTITNKQYLCIFGKIFQFLNHNSLGFIVKFFKGFIVNNVSNKRMLRKKRTESL